MSHSKTLIPIVLCVASLWLSGCNSTSMITPSDHPLDPRNDAFMLAGKAEGFGIENGSPEACALLRLSNEASFEQLYKDVGLNQKAARHIVTVRAGQDAELGTYDDTYVKDLEGLDAIPYIGKIAFEKLLNWSQAHSELYTCGMVEVQLLAFNDFHGSLEPPLGSSGKIKTGPEALDVIVAGGVEYLATHIANLRATNPNTVVVSAGDNIGGSPMLSGLFHEEPTIEALNALGLQVSAVGNHEFDAGPDELQRMQNGGCHPVDGCKGGDNFKGATFQYLASNVINQSTGRPILPAYTVTYFQGANVGFIGSVLQGTPEATSPSNVKGLDFLNEADTINALIPIMKEEGVQIIVVLLHEGGYSSGAYNGCKDPAGPAFEIAKLLDPAVDVIITGHTHEMYVCEIDNTLITSAASGGRLVTDIDLMIDTLTGTLVVKEASNVIVTRTVEKDIAQTALLDQWKAAAAPQGNRIVGVITGDLTREMSAAGESALGDLIADAQLGATSPADKGNAVIAFTNPAGIRADILTAQLSGNESHGEVTYAEAFAVQSFRNTLVTQSLTGAQLKQVLEQQWQRNGGVEKATILQVSQGFSYRYDSALPMGDRVDPASIKLNGVTINPTASYRVTCNAFLAEGGDGFSVFEHGADRLVGITDLDALLAWFAVNSPVSPGRLDRITRNNGS